MVTTFLFDLDGTLLPQNQDQFLGGYFQLLAAHFQPFGYHPKELIAAIFQGTKAMIANNGLKTNEQVFWETFRNLIQGDAGWFEKEFQTFYSQEFDSLRCYCKANLLATITVGALKAKGYQLILATNPLFPMMATKMRIGWANLSASDFSLITTFENSFSSKPNPRYYQEIVKKVGKNPEECFMVGNDVLEDMVAETVGMETFLITDCLINPRNQDISCYRNGSFEDLLTLIEKLPDLRHS